MHELLTAVAELRKRAAELKAMVVRAPVGATALRGALYELETAIYVMERAAADAYRAA